MLKREIKINFKPFLLWSGALMSIYLLVYLVYPSIIASDQMASLDEMLQIFPPEILKAFNMDIASISTAYGWLKTEGFVFILLVTGCYASILGSTILLKEEDNCTIEYLAVLPVKRSSIVLTKYLAGMVYTIAITVAIGIFNLVGLSISGELEVKQYLLLAVTPIFPSVVLFSLSMLISSFFRKTGKMFGLSIGITFISYVLNAVSEMAESVDALKYISVYSLADIRKVITEGRINPLFAVISVVLCALFLMLTLRRYERKELV